MRKVKGYPWPTNTKMTLPAFVFHSGSPKRVRIGDRSVTTMATLAVLFLTLAVTETGSSTSGKVNSKPGNVPQPGFRSKRHTPFMPEDHWKGAPEFGATNTNVTVMVNGTVDLRCPIGHVMDSAVSEVTNFWGVSVFPVCRS